MVRADDDSVCVTLTRSDDVGFRERIRLRPGRTVLKIGRAPECQVNVALPGVSVFHAEIRATGLGEKGKGLSVRDVSTNGTGLQLPGGKKTGLKKGQDTALPDGAMLVVPMNTKKRAGEDKPDAFRIWVTVRIDAGEEETPCLPPDATVLMHSASAALNSEHDAAGKAGFELAPEQATNVSLAQPSESKQKMKIRAAKTSSKSDHALPEDKSQGYLVSPPQAAIDADPPGVEGLSGSAPYARAKGRARKRTASSPVPVVAEAGLAPASETPVSPTESLKTKTSPSKSIKRDKSAEGKSGRRSSGSPSTRRRGKARSSRSTARAPKGKSGAPGRRSREKKGRRRSSRSRRRRRHRSRSQPGHPNRSRAGRRKPEKEGPGGPPMMPWPAPGAQWPWPGGMTGGMATGPGGVPHTPWAHWGQSIGFPSVGASGPPPPHFDLMKQQIFFMYQHFNPMKLPQLDSILEKYKGIEHKLLQALTGKYLGAEAIAPQA